MANIYKILRLGTLIKSKRIRLFGIWMLHMAGKRYIGIFFDPVLACNFRCKMCYFSDEKWRKIFRGAFHYDDIRLIAKALFHRALKLQIGCGAEPTLHKDLTKIIALGKQYKIPYISLTTNGNLLTKEHLTEAIKAGLNEITLSTHGLTRETYEYLMTNGSFDRFLQLLADIVELKKQYADFKLRINYTINNDNMDELAKIWDIAGEGMDILQLRPVQKIGETEYTDFDLTDIHKKYDAVIAPLIRECRRRNIVCLAPAKENIAIIKENKDYDDNLEQAAYCYISPRSCWQDGFDFRTDTFESFAKAHHLGRRLLSGVFGKHSRKSVVNAVRKMNYNITGANR
ncbi:MAG: radical SAM protein [Bacteroidales bacterium]|jgi:molybdenum cofactor biosynthesis enzyme MoaA|nr:radical SAM protein [Bacteroidales bacterium]